MNRNQKIALGCGGGGCLGLILLVILGVVLVVTGVIKAPGLYSPSSNSNYNSNRNSNYNSSDNSNSNSNTNRSSTSSTSSMSDDDKHKLFQAAAASRDPSLTRRVSEKLGLLNADGTPTEEYAQFFKDHIGWLFKNSEFMQSINTPEKARAYAEEHIDD
ncbi:MAG TPA: hypothetical protein VEW46_23470 [Pyrinomonadaceae bacterium]|nr:hypothetical protein [Pyrinomonadaceae bacterium]